MNVQKKSLLFLLPIFFCTLMFAYLSCQAEPKDVIDGISDSEILPNFSAPGLFQSDRPLTKQTLHGQVSLLNVWASWCPACQKEHSMLMTIKNQYHIPIYGLDFKDTEDEARHYLRENGNPYVISGQDPSGEIGDKLGVYGTPITYIIDAKGMIRHAHVGSLTQDDWDEEMWPRIQSYQREK